MLRNLHGQRILWAVVVMGGSLVGMGALAGQAQAQSPSPSYRNLTGPTRPAPLVNQIQPSLSTQFQTQNALNTMRLMNRMPGSDWWRIYPYSPYNIYNPYNPYSPYYGGYYPYGPFYGSPAVYPYIPSSGVYPIVGQSTGVYPYLHSN